MSQPNRLTDERTIDDLEPAVAPLETSPLSSLSKPEAGEREERGEKREGDTDETRIGTAPAPVVAVEISEKIDDLVRWLTPARRKWLYGICASIGALLVSLGLVDDNIITGILGVVLNVLGLSTALAHTDPTTTITTTEMGTIEASSPGSLSLSPLSEPKAGERGEGERTTGGGAADGSPRMTPSGESSSSSSPSDATNLTSTTSQENTMAATADSSDQITATDPSPADVPIAHSSEFAGITPTPETGPEAQELSAGTVPESSTSDLKETTEETPETVELGEPPVIVPNDQEVTQIISDNS